MDFRLSDDQALYAEMAGRFAREHLAAGALQRAHATG